jgi:pimeloyl-ACP methyl ester carboxylesterase
MMEPFPSLAGLGRRLPDGLFFFDSAAEAAGDPPVGASRGGDAPSLPLPLVLVHGLGDEADSFRRLFPLLSPARRVLAPDLPGFGRSPAGGRVSTTSCVRAVLRLLEAECPAGAVVAGSSLGAAIAELASFERPDLVKSLILMDGGIPAAGARLPLANLVPGLGEAAYRAFRGRPEVAYESLRPYYADLDALGKDDRGFLAGRVVERVESESQMRAYFSLLRSFALTVMTAGRAAARRLREGTAPLLVLWGDRDLVMPPAGAGLLAGTAPRAKVVMIAGAGHLPQQERPCETAAAINGFA